MADQTDLKLEQGRSTQIIQADHFTFLALVQSIWEEFGDAEIGTFIQRTRDVR